jgi:hypothetical protein
MSDVTAGGGRDRHTDGMRVERQLLPELEQRFQRLSDWRTRLLAAVRPHDLLVLLHDFGFDDGDVAAAVPHVSERTVRRWRTAGPPTSKAAERWRQLDDLRSIVGFLLAEGSYDEEGIVAWLRSRREGLGWERPLDALADQRFADVLSEAEDALASLPRPQDDVVGPPQLPSPEAVVARTAS